MKSNNAPTVEVLKVFETVPNMYLILSRDLHILTASDLYLEATQTTREKLAGRYIFDAFPDNPATPDADGVKNIHASLQRVLATRKPDQLPVLHYDVPHPTEPGMFLERYWLPSHTPVLDEQGQVSYIIQLAINITDTIQARHQLKASQEREIAALAEIERQRAQLKAILEQAPLALAFMKGEDHRIELANPQICQLWGRQRADLLGRPLWEVLPETRGQGFQEAMANVWRTGIPFRGTEVPTPLMRRGVLETVYFNLVYQPLYTEPGAITGILIAATDVSEQVLARQKVEQSEKTLRELNQELAITNEELQSANEEIQAGNEELLHSQQALQQLNQQLEARVQERTRQAQLARKEAEAQRAELQRVFEQAPVAIAIYRGPQLVIELANPAIGKLWGRPVAPLLGRPLFEALPDARGQGFEELFADLLRSGVVRSFLETPVTMVRQPGEAPTLGYYNFTCQSLPEVPGQPVGLIAVGIDVTEQVESRQRAEALQAELLAAAEHRAQERETFYQVFAQTPAAICIQRGPEHRYQYVNPAYQDLFPDRQFVGRPVAQVLPETVPQGFVALLDKVYQTGETFFGRELPVTLTHFDGSPQRTIYFNFTYQAYQENGQTVGISTFAFDVTEQVQARKERDAQQQQLQALFEQAPVAICLFKGTNYVLDIVNPPMGEMLGRSPAQLIGQPFFEALPELIGQGLEELLEGVRLTGVALVAQERPMQLARHGSGERGYFNFVYQPLRDARGQLMAITCIAVEVTGQVQARQQVEALNKELAAANEELQASSEEIRATNEELTFANQQLTRTNVDLDTFVYTASHDLKAPILNIEGLLNFLHKRIGPAAQQNQTVQEIYDLLNSSVNRFKATIQDLTDVARISKESAEDVGTIELTGVLTEVLEDLEPQRLEALAQIESKLDCPPVLFSKKNLKSILYNLVSNAIKYRSPKRELQVRIFCQTQGDYHVLTVQDNGLGMDMRQEGKIFALFKRLHNHVEGTGVGLYMVKKMIENAGGKIEVESQVGVGSTFQVYFKR